jgi:hypothetical protein
VLALLAEGKTNPQIAETLGLSLAGAKWHVSEVLSRLGVASREEAADYWRKHNRLTSGLWRAVRGLLGGGLFKLAVAGAGVAVVGGAGIFGLSSWRGSDKDTAGPGAPLFSETEARGRALYIAGEFLKQTDIPQRVEVNGRPISDDDLTVVEIVFFAAGETPAFATVRDRSPQPLDRPTWGAVLRRDGLDLTGMAPGDGRVTVSTMFADGSGKVGSAGASQGSKLADDAPQPPPEPTRDPALRERVSDFIPVLRLDAGNLHTTLGVYQTRGGDWCSYSSSDAGGGFVSCPIVPLEESPHIFGMGSVGAGLLPRKVIPGYVRGVLSGRVDYVLLEFEHGERVTVIPVDFPAQTGLNWRAFASVAHPEQGDLLRVEAIAEDGGRLGVYEYPRSTKVPPYIVRPLDSVDVSGSGNGRSANFRLPEPAFPIKMAFAATHDGAGAITADIVCDTGTNRFLDTVGPIAGASGALIADVSPGARTCAIAVEADGAWSFVSR